MKLMMTGLISLKVITITDLHLDVPSVPVPVLIRHLNIWLDKNSKRFEEADIFIINGDLFHRAVSLMNTPTIEIINWIISILELCKKYDLIFRILDGTGSHDYHQSRIFVPLFKALQLGDAKFINDVTVENIKGFNVGWIPDNKGTANSVKRQLVNAMSMANIDELNLLNIHSAFAFNLPPQALSKNTLDEQSFIALVKGIILNGHIHTPMTYEDVIITIGSFDTYNHGEEMDKGGLFLTLFKDDQNNVTYTKQFLKNQNVTIFKTIDLSSKRYDTIPKSLTRIGQVIKPLLRDREHINIRLILQPDHPLLLTKSISVLPPGLINWKFERVKDKSKDLNVDDLNGTIAEEQLVITKDNIIEVLDEFSSNREIDNQHIVLSTIQELLND